jgi:hypothetical protein
MVGGEFQRHGAGEARVRFSPTPLSSSFSTAHSHAVTLRLRQRYRWAALFAVVHSSRGVTGAAIGATRRVIFTGIRRVAAILEALLGFVKREPVKASGL